MNDGKRKCKHCDYEGPMYGLTVSVPDHMGGTGPRGKGVRAEDFNTNTVHPGFHRPLRLCPECERINIV